MDLRILRGKKPSAIILIVSSESNAAVERGALIPYSPAQPYARRAGSDIDLAYGGEPPLPGFFGGMPPPFRGGPFPPPHMLPPHPMMRPAFFASPFPPPPHMMPPPPPHMHMMPPPPSLGMAPPRFPPGMFPPPPMGMMHPRFMPPFGPIPPPMGRPRTPTEGPIITGPESVYGTLPRRPAFEEPIYMPGNMPCMPPQASYQPGNYPADHYDAYYDTYKAQRSPQGTKDKLAETSSRRGAAAEQDESSQFWDAYEAGIYRKPHLNEKAFSATVRSASSALNDSTVVTEADVVRPETPPADYENAFEAMHVSKANNQQRTTAVMY
ncbi:hypothetical protein Tcan_03574 [Toxocara canis]|uniref:Uncharacterized protein n=1 Tax=Toxocara canis TaxID=6265 RepID=A0A0B2VB45_TOXCA|nr:hypothetical protein Tcan_03574 [Toxocara canis]